VNTGVPQRSKKGGQSISDKGKSPLEKASLTLEEVVKLSASTPKIVSEPAAMPRRLGTAVIKPEVRNPSAIDQLLGLLLHNPEGLADKVVAILKDVGPLAKFDYVEAQKVGLTTPGIVKSSSSINGGYSAKVGTIIHFSDGKVITIRKNYTNGQFEVLQNGWDESLDIAGKVRHGLGLDAAIDNGGIDLNAIENSLQAENHDGEIRFHLDPAQLVQLQNAPGFVPVIVTIEPLLDLSVFLGLN
jgi:hypothetical protein